MLVLAGPGSGKTRVVTHRIAHLIARGIPARQIVALSFTNKAADEMRRRVTELVGPQAVEMGTFHRFAARLLRRHASLVGLTSDYSILDPDDAAADNSLCVHGNPNVLTRDAGTSRLAQACTGQLTVVQVEKFVGNAPPVKAFDPPG